MDKDMEVAVWKIVVVLVVVLLVVLVVDSEMLRYLCRSPTEAQKREGS